MTLEELAYTEAAVCDLAESYRFVLRQALGVVHQQRTDLRALRDQLQALREELKRYTARQVLAEEPR